MKRACKRKELYSRVQCILNDNEVTFIFSYLADQSQLCTKLQTFNLTHIVCLGGEGVIEPKALKKNSHWLPVTEETYMQGT